MPNKGYRGKNIGKKEKKVAWGITGAGDKILDTGSDEEHKTAIRRVDY